MLVPDEHLATAAMAGDEGGFEALYTRYYPSLTRYLQRLLANRFLAEDLAQEVFVRFLRQRSYTPEHAFKPWLYAVATNAVRDHLRRVSRRPRSESLEAGTAGIEPDPSDLVVADDTRAQVHAVILQLPLEYRETLSLRLDADLTVGQIAALLRVPQGTVKSRLSTGLKRIRGALEIGEKDRHEEALRDR